MKRRSQTAAGRLRSPEDRSLPAVLLVLSVLLFACMTAALCMGRYSSLSPREALSILLSHVLPLEGAWTENQINVVMRVRLPRVTGAMLVGGALALAGTTFQGVFRNPLVSSDMLGVSNGACIGAALSILLGLGAAATQGLAFVFGIAAVLITTAIPRFMRRESTITLVLSGIIVSGFMSSMMGLIKYLADAETQLPDIVYWTMGTFSKVTLDDVKAIGPLILAVAAVLLALSWRLNLLALGDAEARTLGVHVRGERRIAIVCATLLTASSVCLTGTIGWVGHIMPHIARRLVGSNNVRCLPVSMLVSAIFMLIIDTAARTLTGGELPLSILTGALGAPFFALILVKQKGVE